VPRGLLVVGTGSNVGKSTLVVGLARLLARSGVRVVPFKGQNMALNAAVTADGGEIGRAQALQALAAGVEPTVAMNPVLIKPTAPGVSQLVVRGHPAGELHAADWLTERAGLLEVVLGAYDELAAGADVVLAEGAGSAAEINLLAGDITNLVLAERRGLRAVLVGDIDRGGIFASIYGHYLILPERLRRHLAGFVITKLRGDAGLLAPGIAELARRLGTRSFGVVPWRRLWLPAEDSLVAERPEARVAPGALEVAVLALPHLANATDLDPLYAAGVAVRLVSRPSELAGADLVVVPGSKATVPDLGWLRAQGFEAALRAHTDGGGWLLGICAGYQMLARSIEDPIESGAGRVAGLGLLDAAVRFEPDKVLARVAGELVWPAPARLVGYLMHHGRVSAQEEPLLELEDRGREGARLGRVLGTAVHGLFDDDEARGALLGAVAADRGRLAPAPIRFAEVLEAAIDAVADLVAEHLDVDGLLGLIDGAGGTGHSMAAP